MLNRKANKQTKNKREKELCLDKCTHPKSRDMKRCWAQTWWHFQLMKGFDICSPVTLAGGMNSWPSPQRSQTHSSWQMKLAAHVSTEFISSADCPAGRGSELDQEGWSSGGALCGLCWGEMAITPASRGGHCRKDNLSSAMWCTCWMRIRDTWNIRFCEIENLQKWWPIERTIVTNKMTTSLPDASLD